MVGCEAGLVHKDNVSPLLHQLNHPWYELEYPVTSSGLLLCSLLEVLVHLALLDPVVIVYLPQAVARDRCLRVAVVERLATLCECEVLLLLHCLVAGKEGNLLFGECRLLVISE